MIKRAIGFGSFLVVFLVLALKITTSAEAEEDVLSCLFLKPLSGANIPIPSELVQEGGEFHSDLLKNLVADMTEDKAEDLKVPEYAQTLVALSKLVEVRKTDREKDLAQFIKEHTGSSAESVLNRVELLRLGDFFRMEVFCNALGKVLAEDYRAAYGTKDAALFKGIGCTDSAEGSPFSHGLTHRVFPHLEGERFGSRYVAKIPMLGASQFPWRWTVATREDVRSAVLDKIGEHHWVWIQLLANENGLSLDTSSAFYVASYKTIHAMMSIAEDEVGIAVRRATGIYPSPWEPQRWEVPLWKTAEEATYPSAECFHGYDMFSAWDGDPDRWYPNANAARSMVARIVAETAKNSMQKVRHSELSPEDITKEVYAETELTALRWLADGGHDRFFHNAFRAAYNKLSGMNILGWRAANLKLALAGHRDNIFVQCRLQTLDRVEKMLVEEYGVFFEPLSQLNRVL